MKSQTNFFVTERLIYKFEAENQIIYEAGPVKIAISGYTELITISTSEKWKYLLPEVLKAATFAWELDEQNIINWNEEKTEISISYNFKNLKNYIENVIIFL